MTNLVTVDRLSDIEQRAARLVKATTASLKVPGRRAALRRSLGRPLDHPAVQQAHRFVAPYLPDLPDPDRERMSADTQRDVVAIERAFYTVAALIAAQPRTARDEELGSDAAGDDESSDEATPGGQPGGTLEGTPGGGTSPDDTTNSPDSSTTDSSTTDSSTTQVAGTGFGLRRAPSLGRTVADGVRNGRLNDETTSARLHVLCRQDVAGLHRHLPRLVGHLRADLVPVDWVRLTVDLARWGRYGDQVAKSWLQDYYRRLAMPKDTTPTTAGSGAAENTESELS